MLRSKIKDMLMLAAVAATVSVAVPTESTAQTHRTDDPVIHRMWEVGMENSQTETLAQILMDSIRFT